MLAVAPAGRQCENHDPKQRSGATSGLRAPAAAEAKTTAPACDLKKVEVIEHRRRTALGEELVTRYVKGRLLGKGGFAKVYLVTTEDTHQHYAMKVVPRSLLTKRRAKDKLRTEIKIHRSIAHPRVVRFHAYFEDADNVYILLELCTNGTLSELMRRRRRFDAAEARKYMLQMLEAVHYCHRHGIIHRDLKLGNLFLDGAWDIKMGDFGLAAKVTGDDARRKTICGTPNYIAPEILEGSGTGHSYQVDVWSMGVVLYTMLVGRPPFESRDVKSTYRRILQNVYAFPEGTAVSEDAKGLVRCMLQTAPDQRPTLEEILNHPFLRDGGAARSFNTTYTLRPDPSSGGAAAAAAAACAPAAPRQLRSGAAAACGVAAPAPAPRPPLVARDMNRVPAADHHRNAGARPTAAASGGGHSAPAPADENAPGQVLRGIVSPGAQRAAAAAAPQCCGDALHGGRSAARAAPAAAYVATTANPSWSGGAAAAAASAAAPAAPPYRRAQLAPPPQQQPALTKAAPLQPAHQPQFNIYKDVARREANGGGAASLRAGSAAAAAATAAAATAPALKKPLQPITAAAAAEAAPRRRSLQAADNNVLYARAKHNSAAAAGAALTTTPYAPRRGGCVGSGAGGGAAGVRCGSTEQRTPARTAAAAGVGTPTRVRTPSGVTRTPLPPARLQQRAAAGAAKPVWGMAARVEPGGSSERCRRAAAADALPAAAKQQQQLRQRTPGSSGGGGARPFGAVIAAAERSVKRDSDGSGARLQVRGGAVTPARRAGGALNGGGGGSGHEAPRGGVTTPLRRRAAGADAMVLSTPEADRMEAAVAPRDGEAAAAAAAAAEAELREDGAARQPAAYDEDTLECMFSQLALLSPQRLTAAAGLQRGGSATAASAAAAAAPRALAAPAVWITQYVDYCSKYGVGFLLNTGSAGVYFNDATKMVLDPAGHRFEYWERSTAPPPSSALLSASAQQPLRGADGDMESAQQPLRGADGHMELSPSRAGGAPQRHGGSRSISAAAGSTIASGVSAMAAAAAAAATPVQTHTLSNYPSALQKKVTLLTHFRSFLFTQERRAGRSGGAQQQRAAGAAAAAAAAAPAPSGEPLVHVKKYVATRYAWLFRLSNGTLQVIFTDGSEVLIGRSAHAVTYVARDGTAETLELRAVVAAAARAGAAGGDGSGGAGARAGIVKRLTYTKEMLEQLIAGHKGSRQQ